MSNKERGKTDVLQGTLDLMVLQTLAALGPLHGYAIAARLEEVSQGALQLNMGTLYPGLMRLEQRGLLRGAWGLSDRNRKARFYTITAAGRRQLSTEKSDWQRMASIMAALLDERALTGEAHAARVVASTVGNRQPAPVRPRPRARAAAARRARRRRGAPPRPVRRRRRA